MEKPIVFKDIPVSKIKIGHFFFKIEQITERESQLGNQHGHCDVENQCIRVQESLKGHFLVNVLLHETIHAIHWFFNLDDNKGEEEFTELTANGILMVMRDNPEFWIWIMENTLTNEQVSDK